jgi:hypothetical protein
VPLPKQLPAEEYIGFALPEPFTFEEWMLVDETKLVKPRSLQMIIEAVHDEP